MARNKSTVSVFVGPADVTTSTGFELQAGETISLDARAGEEIFGVVASGTALLHVLETSV